MSSASAVFLINLVQDVTICRPLVFMAARDFGLKTEFLVSPRFGPRDISGQWRRELTEIGAATGSAIHDFGDEVEAAELLAGKGGILIASSESNLSAHDATHEVFRVAPSSFVKVTLQHGFECVGFRQSRQHDIAHGREVAFGADVVCAWSDDAYLSSMLPSQRSKLYVTGPPAVLQLPHAASSRGQTGLVCENMHSVRLNISGDFKADFITVFNQFCAALAKEQRDVVLRPHPGGQYVLRNLLSLPKNVVLNNNPIYKVELGRYAYGISAPSSVLIDMMLADIPVAVWRDSGGIMDADNYSGLTEISSVQEWIDFSREAISSPQRFIDLQHRFLEKEGMPTDPKEVYRRFAELFASVVRRTRSVKIAGKASAERVMFVANGYLPTLQLSFVKPLTPLVERGEMALDYLTEEQMREAFRHPLESQAGVTAWLDERLQKFSPTLMVFCRYSGPFAEHLTEWARRRNIPVIYHIDDDLLSIPPDIGAKKHAFHNAPRRTATVRHLLNNVDVVYCSTRRLEQRLQELGAQSPTTFGEIYCSGEVIAPAAARPVRRVGYMASADHAHNLDAIMPALVEFLRRNPDIEFELFGSIPVPEGLREFESRIRTAPPVMDYEKFLAVFASREWDVGLCPLTPIQFNLMKANTKWVEYTAAGVAVIASRDTVYDECCADGCGILAGNADEWLAALELLARDPNERYMQASRAQEKLAARYSIAALQRQVLGIFELAKKNGEQRRKAPLLESTAS
jgi:glycosyltransferase involved in cell wall biosynthesis